MMAATGPPEGLHFRDDCLLCVTLDMQAFFGIVRHQLLTRFGRLRDDRDCCKLFAPLDQLKKRVTHAFQH